MEEKSIIINEIPKSFMKKSLGMGCNAECFLTDFGVVFKKFHFLDDDYKDILKSTKYNSNTFVFPKLLVFLNNYNSFAGYFMNYVEGDTIKNINKDVNINNYINAIKKVEDEIKVFTNYKFYLRDMAPTNVIYTKDNQIKIIDTDFYEHNSNKKNLFAKNLIIISDTVTSPIMDLFETEFKSQKLNKYKRMLIDSRMLPSSFVEEIISELIKYNYENETIGECKNGVLKLTK